jgi:hypothetical protein
MGALINMALGMYTVSKANEEKMNVEMKEKAEQDVQKYWNACNYPRKIKKRMRKEAQSNYTMHMTLAQPFLFK